MQAMHVAEDVGTIIKIFYLMHKYFFSCLYTLCLINGVVCILIQYFLPLSLPENFENNVKQVIDNLGKYMR